MPLEVLIAVLACTLATWVPGTPLALLALRRTEAGSAVVLTAAAGLGLCTWMLVGLPAVHQGWFSPGPLVAVVIALSALAWVPARRHLHRLRPRRPGWLGASLVVLAVPALWLRSSPIYFAYQVADFGEYVNRGNVIAQGGPFGGWFVDGFPLVMGEAHLLLGQGRSVHVMPFLGLLVGATVLALLQLVRVPRAVVAIAALPFGFHVHAVWFSQFPASETLYAALLALSLLLAAAALTASDHATAAAGGAVGFLLVLTRGNGLVYLPLVVLGLALVPVLTDAARAAVLRTHLAVLAAGLWAGSLYDARHNPTYFLDQQAVPRLPGPIADTFGRLDEVPIAAAYTVVVAVGVAAAAGCGVLLGRLHRHPRPLRWLRVGTVALVVVAVLAAHVSIPSVSFLPRYEVLGAPAAIALALALAVWLADAVDDGATRFLIGWPLVTGVVMATFQASRMRKSMTIDAHWFLYWDRYFWSEALPLLLVAGAVAAGVIVHRAAARPARARRAVQVGLAAVVVAIVVDVVPPTWRTTEGTMFEDTYEELAAIDALMPERLPVVYDGLVEHPRDWFWPNSSRVLASPLSETFGHRITNLSGALDPDARPDADEVVAAIEHHGTDRGYLLQVRPTPDWEPVEPALDVEVRGEVVVPIERLEGRSAVRPEDQPWITTTVHVRVLEVAAG